MKKPKLKSKIDPVVLRIQRDITAKVSKENKHEFEKACIAADQVMFDEKSHANMQLVKNPIEARQDIVGTISKGVTGLMWLLYQQSKQTMPPEVLVFAGIIAMTKAIDFAQRGLGIPISPDQIAQITQEGIALLFGKMGVTPEKLNEVIMQGKKEIEEYQKHQGFMNSKIAQMKGGK